MKEKPRYSNRLVEIVVWSVKSWIVCAIIVEIVILLISLVYYLLRGGNLLALPIVGIALLIVAIRPSLLYGFMLMLLGLITKFVWKDNIPSTPEILDRFRPG
jgi:hypothetical protein